MGATTGTTKSWAAWKSRDGVTIAEFTQIRVNEPASGGFTTKVLIHTALSHGIHCYRALWILTTTKKTPHALFTKSKTKKHKSLHKKHFITQRCALWPWTTTSWALRAHRGECPRMTAPFLSFLRHLLLATIADKIPSSMDLWSRPVQSLPFVLAAKHFHWYNTTVFIRIPSVHTRTYYQLCNSCNAYDASSFKNKSTNKSPY